MYQFQIDNRAASPRRHTWGEAAADAVANGYATRVADGVRFDAQASVVPLASPAPKEET